VISGAELNRSVLEIFHALRDNGVRKGDVVAVLVAPNSPEMLTVRYAAHLLGSAVCYLRSAHPVSSAAVLPPERQIQILRDTQAVTLYTDAESVPRARELSDGAGGLPVTRVRGAGGRAGGRADEAGAVRVEPWDPYALAVIAYTSGSTGRPKGIRLSARAWNGLVRSMTAADRPAENVKFLVTTPLSHTVGSMADSALALGAEVHLHEEFDAEWFVRTVPTRGSPGPSPRRSSCSSSSTTWRSAGDCPRSSG
jgi:fatty-acyl-CoA synthase